MDPVALNIVLRTGFPPSVWCIPFFVLAMLAIASFHDARTGRVPDVVLGVGGFVALAGLAWGAGWMVAGARLVMALGSVVVLYMANNLYYRLNGHDAFGFGDAKWTGLAVAGFGWQPACWAWVWGAWLALLWLALRWLWRKVSPTYGGHFYVHFAPFLFLGLLASFFKEAIWQVVSG